jgi:hypothetical protein
MRYDERMNDFAARIHASTLAGLRLVARYLALGLPVLAVHPVLAGRDARFVRRACRETGAFSSDIP